jgi:hypothetical protein
MSFVDYAALQSNVASWLARDDLTAYIPDFIRLFECAAGRKLKARLQETTATLTPVSGVVTLPTDYLGHRRVTWTGSPRIELSYVAPPLFQAQYPTQTSGNPSIFTIEGSSLRLMPQSDTNIELDYYQRTTGLSSGLNWLYTYHPDAYLFGSLAEANAFNKDVDPAGLWKARRDEVFNEIMSLDFNERQGMAVRTVNATP